MKRILLALFFIGICGVMTAQKKYRIAPGNTLRGTAQFGSYTNFEIFQENISTDTITLKWQLISNKLIKGWDYSTCAFGTCYASIPDSLCTMRIIPPGESGFLALNVDPLNIQGSGSASIYVYENGKPSTGDTVTFLINAGPNGIADYKLQDVLTVFPNPASEAVNFKLDNPAVSSASIQIMNSLGKEVYNTRITGGNPDAVNINAFAAGIYFVKCNYENGSSSIKKLEIIK